MVDQSEDFTETASAIARGAGRTADTVRLYATMGLLECRVASNGTRLFRKADVDRVREIYERRIANRGRRPAA